MASRGAQPVTIPAGRNIGEELRQRRLTIDVSIRELARQAELSHGYISLIESGRRNPRARTVKQIMVALAEIEAARAVAA